MSTSRQRSNRRRSDQSAVRPPAIHAEVGMLHFEDPAHLARFERLRKRKFQDCRYIDWDVLEEIHLSEEVGLLIGHSSWDAFFAINELGYREVTLEFLSTFTMETNYYTMAGSTNRSSITATISFRVHRRVYSLSLQEFTSFLHLYDEEFLNGPQYHDLHYTLPHGVHPESIWRSIADGPPYEAKSSKASYLISPAVHYLHHLLSHTLSGRGESSGVVSTKDIIYLYSMTEHFPLHLGYFVATFIRHQAEHGRVGTICIAPYITLLLKGMNIFDGLPPMEVVARTIPISMASLRSLRIVRARPGVGRPVYQVARHQEEVGDEVEEERNREEVEEPHDIPQQTRYSHHGASSSHAPQEHHSYDDLYESYAFFRMDMTRRLDRVEQNQEAMTDIFAHIDYNQEEILRNQRDMQAQYEESNQWTQTAIYQLCDHFEVAMPPPPDSSSRRRRDPPPPPTF